MSSDPAPPVASPSVALVERRPNPLLDREEVTFRLDFDGPMVSRAEALQVLASSLQVPLERVAIRRLRVSYGRPGATGLARVYATPEALKRTEPPHIVRRLSGEKRETGKRGEPKKEEAKPAGSAAAAPPQARAEKRGAAPEAGKR